MYAWPTALPVVTNREDLTLTLALFDDDLGQPINIAGVQLANSALPFTSTAWTVIDGSIVTTSATSITIPTYPFSNQLSALALTVGLGLNILPGDFVTIQDTLTGQNKMFGYVTSYTSTSGALIVQIGSTFEFEIRRRLQNLNNSDYVEWYDFGGPDNSSPLLSAQLGNGITFLDVGFIQIQIPASLMQQLHSGTHIAALTMTDSINTRQVFVAELPIIFGGTQTKPQALTTPPSWAAQF